MKKHNRFIPMLRAVTLSLAIGLALAGCKNPSGSVDLPPEAPTGLVFETKTETTIDIAWDGVDEAAQYHVYAGVSAQKLTLRGVPKETSFKIQGLTANTTYYIAVSAKNDAGESAKSDAISVTTDTVQEVIPVTPEPVTPNLPGTPDNLISTDRTGNSITIAWDEVSGAVKYHVYAGTVAGSLTLFGSTTEPSYLLEGLTSDVTYYVAVSAEDEVGEGDKSPAITVTTNLSAKPDKPSGLAAGEITKNSIAVSWSSVEGALEYKVFAGTTIAGMTLRGNTAGTSYLIAGLNPNIAYYIAVSARTASNESDQSASVRVVTKPAALVDLAAAAVTSNSIAVSWTSMIGVSYTVYAGLSADNMPERGYPASSSFNITGLTANTAYYIAVSAKNESGAGEKSAVITVTTNVASVTPVTPGTPVTPANLTSTDVTGTSITIAWDEVSGALKYHVYAGTVAGSLALLGSPTETSYLIEGLAYNATYYIEVSAENGVGEGERSAPITVTTNQSVKPDKPTGLAAGDTTENSIAVSWSSVSGAIGYKVFAGATDADMTLRGSPTQTSFTITGLNANTLYHIAVSALTASNESDESDSISKYTKPAAPANLTAGTITSNSIAVTWDEVSGVTGYTVYAGTTSGNLTQRGTPTTNSLTITGLPANTAYYIAVSAKNASGEGSKSTSITATTKLPAPEGLIATPQPASGAIQVSWNTVNGATQYKVYRSSSETGTYTTIVTTTGTSYNDTGRTQATDYFYKVSALTAGNAEGELSAVALGRIPVQTKAITQFRFGDFSVDGTINGTNISVTVPNIVNLTTLVPTITHNGKSLSPASGVAQDFSSQMQYTVTAEDNTTQNYTVTVSVTNTTLAAAITWIRDNYSDGRTYTVIAQANESLAPVTISAAADVNINLSGGSAERTISLSSNGSFTVRNAILTLGNNITLQGRSNSDSLVKVNSFGKLIMKTGSKIQNNTIDKSGGSIYGAGVYIDGGAFVMDGGTISGCKLTAKSSTGSFTSSVTVAGGGVYLNSGSFVMNDGTITGNSLESDMFNTAGGGVYIKTGAFTMNGGTISNNKVDSYANWASPIGYGGGVAAWESSSTFTMTGGTISGNNARGNTSIGSGDYAYGGGVYVRTTGFTKTGGTISSNSVTCSNSSRAIGSQAYAAVSSALKRNSAAGPTVNLNSATSGSAGGWE